MIKSSPLIKELILDAANLNWNIFSAAEVGIRQVELQGLVEIIEDVEARLSQLSQIVDDPHLTIGVSVLLRLVHVLENTRRH